MIKKMISNAFSVTGEDVSYINVKKEDEQSGWVGDLYSADDVLLASDRDFPIGSAPFDDLNIGEVEYLEKKRPRKGWLKALTQRWMTEHQTQKGENGKTLKTDPLYFTTSNTELELLSIIDSYLSQD